MVLAGIACKVYRDFFAYVELMRVGLVLKFSRSRVGGLQGFKTLQSL